MQQNFLDGTPCSDFGTCNNGQCNEPSPLKQVELFAHKYKAKFAGIVIGVAVVVIILLYVCYSCCRAAKDVKQSKADGLQINEYHEKKKKEMQGIYEQALFKTGGPQDADGNWMGAGFGRGRGRGMVYSPGGASNTAPSIQYWG